MAAEPSTTCAQSAHCCFAPANDNQPPGATVKNLWTSGDLRLTKWQADFLKYGSSSIHRRIEDRTELILKSGGMLCWRRSTGGEHYLAPSPKGEAALHRHNQRGNTR